MTKEMFRVGLRPMNVITEVVNKTTVPTDTESKESFVYHAEKTVAAVVAQTYKYMLEGGYEYGCLITGECIVFLRLLEEDSNTLYYHLSEPLEQFWDKHGNFLYMRTAIAQMISIIHMAGQSEDRGPVWCNQAIKRAKTWDLTRRFGKKAMRDYSYRPGPQFHPDDSDDSDDSGGPAGGRGKRGGPSDSSMHRISQKQLCTQIQQQLGRNLDYNCTDLQIQGSRCMLFKVSLASYGYTFVAKGTRDVFVVNLKREVQMYDRLHSMQSIDIPVHLGNNDLTVPWCAIGGVRVIHMLLLAYRGVSLDHARKVHNLDSRVQQFKRKIALLGVNHGDLELRNMLWSPELQCVLFIDFERSTLAKDTPALQEISPNRQLNRTVPRTPTKKLKSGPSWFEIHEDQPLVLPFPSPVKETRGGRTPLGKGLSVKGDKENALAAARIGLEDQEDGQDLQGPL
ncbi:MAG: hypothetical protein Q9203_002358 [Teloschistes exilis]